MDQTPIIIKTRRLMTNTAVLSVLATLWVGSHQSDNHRPPPNDICSQARLQNGVIPHPQDCSAIVWCQNKNPNVKKCPLGYQFNVQNNMCDDSKNVDCKGNRTIDNHKFKNAHFFLNDTNLLPAKQRIDTIRENTRSEVVTNGRSNHIETKNRFSERKSRKLLTSAANYNPLANRRYRTNTRFGLPSRLRYNRPPDVCKDTRNGKVAHPVKCSKYILCTNHSASAHDCRLGQYFDMDSKKCVANNRANCGSSNANHWPSNIGHNTGGERNKNARITITNFCKDTVQQFGSFPHPNNCSMYINCYFYETRSKSCKHGEKFDKNWGSCRSSEKAKCGKCPVSWKEHITGYIDCVGDRKIQMYQLRHFCTSRHNRTEPNPHPSGIIPRPRTIYPHPTSCSMFIHCTDYEQVKTVSKYCNLGEKFDVDSNKCVSSASARCKKPVLFQICKDFGIKSGKLPAPMPMGCSWFTSCSNYTTSFVRCEDWRERFDADSEKCVLPALAKCSNITSVYYSSNTKDNNSSSLNNNKDKKSNPKCGIQPENVPCTKDKPVAKNTKHCPRIVCYLNILSSSSKRSKKPKQFQNPRDINGNLCTHVIIYHARAVQTDGNLHYPDRKDEDFLRKITASLKRQNPQLKILFNVVDHKKGSFITMLKTWKRRHTFILSVMTQLNEAKNVDGIDLFWRNPGPRNRETKFGQRVVKLIKEFRKRLDREKKGYLLTAMVKFKPDVYADEVGVLSKNFDFINLRAFEMLGRKRIKSMKQPQHHSALKSTHQDGASVDKFVKTWIDSGADKSRLVLIIPFFGKQYFVGNRNVIILPLMKLTRRKAYYEICTDRSYHQREAKHDDSYTITESNNGTTGEYYHYVGHFISFDGLATMRAKTRYVLEKGLGGVGAYKIDQDDYSGESCNEGKFPLLTAINNVCYNKIIN